MNRHASRLGLVLALSCVNACEAAPDDGSNYCETNADCPLGRVCLSPNAECTEELIDGFVGTFSCTVVGPNTPWSLEEGTTDVVGWFGENRFALNQAAQCVLSDGELTVFVFKEISDVEIVYAGVRFPTTAPGMTDANAGGLYVYNRENGNSQLAGTLAADGGLVDLYQPVTLGEEVSGFVLFGFVP